ncbi:hypothetical protein RAS1_31750 [Phycisphaerae bacterium RAS1]|nr:hypothetical protein RAS1_31750 [Phycisphaerae bacterium RAS1]
MCRRTCACCWVVMMLPPLGCVAPRHEPRIAVDTPEPIEAEFRVGSRQIIADRFVLIPTGIPLSESGSLWPVSGSYLNRSAWSGEVMSSGGFWLNLDVIDLQKNSRRRLFDRQVALGPRQWFDVSRSPLLANSLVFPARTMDTTGDGYIDSADAVFVYLYDMASDELSTVSPDGYSVRQHLFLPDRIVLLASKIEGDGKSLDVYVYEPSTRSGRFVVEGMMP